MAAPASQIPIHISGVDVAPDVAGKSVYVNVHYIATGSIGMTQGDTALVFYAPASGTNWAIDRFKIEDELWQSFVINRKATTEKLPPLMVPTDEHLYFTISGVPLSADRIDQLRSGKAMLYYMATMNYQGGSIDLCGFFQSDTGASFLCHDHDNVQTPQNS